MTLAWLLAAWLLADFLSGVVHWWEDRYGDPSWPILGPSVIQPNILHHTDQLAFVRKDYIERNWTAILPAGIAALLAGLAGSPFLVATFLMLSQANEIHAWAHQKCSRPIRGLQLLGLLQSPEQHAAHHKRPFDRNYCTMTDWLNPVLSYFDVWGEVEELAYDWLGILPRVERWQA